MERGSERHHMLWTRLDWQENPLAKRVRSMSTFILDAHHPNHRLLHASTSPPKVPDRETLQHMQELAPYGLGTVLARLEHPIVNHIERQLGILALPPAIALDKLETGLYERPHFNR